MSDEQEHRPYKKLFLISVAIISVFIVEHGVGYAAIKTGLVQGQFKPPAIAFGGFDPKHEQQMAMLSDNQYDVDRVPLEAREVPSPQVIKDVDSQKATAKAAQEHPTSFGGKAPPPQDKPAAPVRQ